MPTTNYRRALCAPDKIMGAKTVASAHPNRRPESILLMPSSTGFDYQVFSARFPYAKFFAVEKNTNIWHDIFETGNYEKVFRGDINCTFYSLRPYQFDIIYLDLINLWTQKTLTSIESFVFSNGFRSALKSGGTLGITVKKRPDRGARVLHPDLKWSGAREFSQSVAEDIQGLRRLEDLGLRVRPVDQYQYTNVNARFITMAFRVCHNSD